MPASTEQHPKRAEHGLATAPVHARIAATLRQSIEDGELALGALLPSERQLASDLGVSRMTARQALMILESEGHVRRQAPTGTVVSRRLPMRIGSFSDEVVRGGATPGDQLLSATLEHAPAPARQALALRAGAKVHAISRLRTADGEPVALEMTYFPARLTPGLLDLPLSGSLWQILRAHYDVSPERAVAEMEIVTLDEASATLLDARVAAPGIQLTRRTFDGDGRCVEFARDIYRADRVRFEVSAEIPTRSSEA
jgi:GntR family transcriptional regulator